MKNRIAFVTRSFLFLGILWLSTFSMVAAQDNLTVVSYNIFNAQSASGKGESTLQEIADFFSEVQPDLISIQEVDSATHRLAKLNDGHYFSLADSLAELTGMHTGYGKAIEFDGGGYGIAILSKKPVDIHKITLPNPMEGETRVLLNAEIQITNEKSLTFAATHLDHEYQKNRLKQIEAINKSLLDKDHPFIMAGDLNFGPGSEEYLKTQKYWTDIAVEEKWQPDFTYPTSNPSKRIDYVLIAPAQKWKVLSYQTPKLPYSDHFPVVVRLVLL